MEKKCVNCNHMNFCQVYRSISNLAGLLNMNLEITLTNEMPYEYFINEIAHNCKNFEKIEGE